MPSESMSALNVWSGRLLGSDAAVGYLGYSPKNRYVEPRDTRGIRTKGGTNRGKGVVMIRKYGAL